MEQNQKQDYERVPVPNFKDWEKITLKEKRGDGKTVLNIYFYNAKTGESTYSHPKSIQKNSEEIHDLLFENKQTEDNIAKLQAKLKDDLGFQLIINKIEGQLEYYVGSITASPAFNEQNLNHFMKLLEREVYIYDKEFIKKSELKKIILCQNLKFSNQVRAAVPSFQSMNLYLDINKQSDVYICNTFHHEYYHLIDFSIWQNMVNNNPDKEWNSLNEPDFQYSCVNTDKGNMVGGANMRDPKECYKKVKGFRNNYSTTSQSEDKAEIWSALMLYPDYGCKNMEENNKNLINLQDLSLEDKDQESHNKQVNNVDPILKKQNFLYEIIYGIKIPNHKIIRFLEQNCYIKNKQPDKTQE